MIIHHKSVFPPHSCQFVSLHLSTESSNNQQGDIYFQGPFQSMIFTKIPALLPEPTHIDGLPNFVPCVLLWAKNHLTPNVEAKLISRSGKKAARWSAASYLCFGRKTEASFICFGFLVFHVFLSIYLRVWVCTFTRTMCALGERSMIVIQAAWSSLVGWGHYKAPPCISSQEVSISFNWIDKWKEGMNGIALLLYCWGLSFLHFVCEFVLLDSYPGFWKQRQGFFHVCLFLCGMRLVSSCRRSWWNWW